MCIRDRSSSKTGDSDEKAARGQVLRQLLITYKNTDKSCKFCPTHPEVPVEWTAGNGYTRLKCLHETGHAINIFAMLENFNLDPLPDYCQVDLAYVEETAAKGITYRTRPLVPLLCSLITFP